MKLPEGLTEQHIIDAHNRGDKVMIYRKGVVDVVFYYNGIMADKEKPIREESVKKTRKVQVEDGISGDGRIAE